MIKIGMEELERARQLQEEAAKLHLPSPPVASFKISRKEQNGEEKDVIIAKSNSYLRNAYNSLVHDFTFASNMAIDVGYFGDGALSYQDSSGNRSATPPRVYGTNYQLSIELRLGTNGTPDTLDDTTLDEVPTADWRGSQDRFSTFDTSSRRFITLIRRNMYNVSDTTYEIKESGIYVIVSGRWYLMVRDTFPVVTFAPGDNITFTYQLEVYYPSNN